MSGGVDSNALISIAKRVLKYDVHGFTIMSDDPRYDEGEIVRDAVQTLDVRHTPVHVTAENFLGRLRDLVNYHDAPVFTITYYVQWLLMEHVKQAGYKISISGTAADELFSGYYDHYLMYLAECMVRIATRRPLAAWQRARSADRSAIRTFQIPISSAMTPVFAITFFSTMMPSRSISSLRSARSSASTLTRRARCCETG